MFKRILYLQLLMLLITSFFITQNLFAVPSGCENCHIKISPMQVKDFNSGKMSESMTCADCHGEDHSGSDDFAYAQLPTIETCGQCHEEKAEQHLSGKHALAAVAMNAMPYTHMQPSVLIEGQKGCGACHALGVTDQSVRESEERQYYPYGMDCQICHTRHIFSKAEALEPEACQTCHMGFDHAQWEMWSGSKHGVTYLMNRDINSENRDRTPKCQTCHMPNGNHRVFSAWGFLAVRLPEDDEEWMGYRTTILKGFGILDPAGNPTNRLELVKAGKIARLTKEDFDAERKRFTDVCKDCHSPNFVKQNIYNADQMVKEADKILAGAIGIVAGLYKDNIIERHADSPVYPDLLNFYNVNTKIEQILYEMFMDHRMKMFQGAFHMNADYSFWYGFAKMKKDLVEIKELAAQMRDGKK
ncbi:cytochrome c3 family protein [candidate division KSB1 bacterium]|nr:cytochrome c3 family protein [candidate division KSB1 bacterium]